MKKEDLKILSNKTHPKIRLNSICPYFTMFPLQFPYNLLQKAKKTDVVYDPFCGRGTTNFAARLLGIDSYGVDSNPVAGAIAQSKLVNVKPAAIVNLCLDILLSTNPKNVPSGEFCEWAFDADTLNDICKIREYLNNKSSLTKTEIALRAIILGVLHGPIMKGDPSYLSNQMPRTFATKPEYSVNYWKKENLVPKYVGLVPLIKRRSEYIFNDQIPKNANGKIILADSRNVKHIIDKKFTWTITSPPYFGMSTYPQDQWLRNWFLGDSDKVNYSTKSQIKHYSENVFVSDLSEVWKNVAIKSTCNANLFIRFGALPSKSDKTPSYLIKESLKLADCGWKITTIKNAGQPTDSTRQANQFKNSTGKYVEEIDVYAVLKN
ncbi:MAG TPA: DNA methyltransferase [Chitinophagaceae bacterium]|nr:DNA methyltransferase [Chitinophagaceae bacterium]